MLDIPRSEVAWEYWLPTPFARFPFTSPPVRHRVPPGSERALLPANSNPSVAVWRSPVLFYSQTMKASFHVDLWVFSAPCATELRCWVTTRPSVDGVLIYAVQFSLLATVSKTGKGCVCHFTISMCVYLVCIATIDICLQKVSTGNVKSQRKHTEITWTQKWIMTAPILSEGTYHLQNRQFCTKPQSAC